MARKAKSIKPRPLYVPRAPTGASWFESDSYDRRTWSEIVADAPSIAELAEAGDRIVPHFGALVQDFFFALFKMNPAWHKTDDVRRAATLNRTILEQIVPSPSFQALRLRTELESDKAAIAAIVMSEQALEMIRSERLINRSEMADLQDLARQEEDLENRGEAVKTVAEMAEPKEGEPALGESEKKKLAQMAEAAERAAKVSEARLNQKARRFEDAMKGADQTALKRMQLQTAELAKEIDRAAEDSHDFSREFGQGGRVSAGARLELGRRLARNKKLGELARMVGRFKQDARALKHKTLERGVAEAYDVELGADIGRLIPSELLAMHHPALRRDFHRRLLEGTVLQYRLRDDEQKGKGPMVVCIDVSSSMQGDKEMWSKAVALTLMDIARRQRRLFRAVMFSSGDTSLKVLDLNRERRYQPELAKVVEMAEYFPGGGTDFEQPIDAAVALISEKKLKRADIVIITDGESQVSPEWLARLLEAKRALQFSIFGVLVDVGSADTSSLKQFADRITSVKRISDDHARDIFLTMQA
ncbi:MAG: VWA domain-containing protein [Candidatus Binatus sp.]|uniref:vWA domain-containing protein n=1 Tax=Candidatus Binatus sp. TaxID=2811406 RepID=UPI00271D6829|nr:VWA domain-containing protein [Candidatus Binatus sp.]MDO8431548.1 VWA domain-containing protein [Candidatus Binatus sp.]